VAHPDVWPRLAAAEPFAGGTAPTPGAAVRRGGRGGPGGRPRPTARRPRAGARRPGAPRCARPVFRWHRTGR
jgi:hypothetical protein